jgi:hypothetical protein
MWRPNNSTLLAHLNPKEPLLLPKNSLSSGSLEFSNLCSITLAVSSQLRSYKSAISERKTYDIPLFTCVAHGNLTEQEPEERGRPEDYRGDSTHYTLFKSHHFPTFAAYSVWYQPPETRHFFGPTQLHLLPVSWQVGISGQLCTSDRERI